MQQSGIAMLLEMIVLQRKPTLDIAMNIEGVTRNLEMAEYWYLRAAKQGNLRAQEGLERVRSSYKNDDCEKKQIYTKLVTALKNKLHNHLQEQLLIYQLFGMSPPEEYNNIK